ncbi:MAG TPA: hypothetical protein VFQ79_12505 [Bryobacteraceae bacterium]|nr:hypothetical protein [Bryobacteraceae bacterium]
MIGRDNFDALTPQKEAAMFYGLFLRGHSVDALRKDIDIPRATLDKWLNTPRFEPDFQDNLKRVYAYRKQVLAIFDQLVTHELKKPRLH